VNTDHSFLFLFLGSATLDLSSVGNVEFLDSLKSEISLSLRVEGKSLDDFADSVDSSSKIASGVDKSSGGVLLSLGDLVVRLVLLEKSDDSSLCLLCLDLS
jgi:hypothetical protein